MCLVVVPSGACLVASSPDAPGVAEGLAYGRCEQPARFGHRHADQPDVAGWFLAGAGGELAGVAPVFRLVSGAGAGLGRGGGARRARGPGFGFARWPGGRDGEQREGAHGQHGVAVEGVPEAELVLVKAGLPLGLLVALFNRPPLMPMKRKLSLA